MLVDYGDSTILETLGTIYKAFKLSKLLVGENSVNILNRNELF